MAGILLTLAAVFMLLSLICGVIRLVKGPTAVDRVIAIDLLTLISMSLIVLIVHFTGRVIYVDVAIVYGLLSFLGVLSVARYYEGGF